MRRLSALLTICIGLDFIKADAALSNSVIVGANVYDEWSISQTAQDAEINQLAANGVKTIRTCLCRNYTNFIIKAFQRGITAVVIAYPGNGSKAKSKESPLQLPLSEADPQGFVSFYKPVLDTLESAGVRLAAIELGNEFNSSGYNGDVPASGSGRVLGLSDLNNPQDTEGAAIAKGFRNYLQVLAALKDLRNHLTLNRTTPIISGSMADYGLPSPKSWNKQVGVSIPDAIEFLRQNGLDKLVDGYGVHVYPTGDLSVSVAARIAPLEQDIFAACKRKSKPCWLTEWGFTNHDQSCPINDEKRAELIEAERHAFRPFIDQGRLVAALYFSWSNVAGKNDNDSTFAVFRCGSLTDAGKLALRPM